MAKPNEKPLWVIGYIDSNGAIEAKAIYSGDYSSHTLDTSKGSRWRFNIPEQCWGAPRGCSELTDDQVDLVIDWLKQHGYSPDDLADERK